MADGVLITWPMIYFFTLQALGLFLERQYTKLTGSRVKGIAGYIWGFVFLTITGGETRE